MNIKKQLDFLCENLPSWHTAFIDKSTLDHIFQNNVRNFTYNAAFFSRQFIFFEEDDTIHYLLSTKQNDPSIYCIHISGGKMYQTMSDELLHKLVNEDRNKKEKDPALQFVLNHPSLRLKTIFLGNEK